MQRSEALYPDIRQAASGRNDPAEESNGGAGTVLERSVFRRIGPVFSGSPPTGTGCRDRVRVSAALSGFAGDWQLDS